jgi:hypothetical protein
MTASWFFTQLPPSRHAIENELRLTFWKAGVGKMWFSCTKETPPFECDGTWGDKRFTIEWATGDYLLLKMPEVDQALLDAFQQVLKHKAVAAYRNGGGHVVVEWRVKGADARFQELATSGAGELERLDK